MKNFIYNKKSHIYIKAFFAALAYVLYVLQNAFWMEKALFKSYNLIFDSIMTLVTFLVALGCYKFLKGKKQVFAPILIIYLVALVIGVGMLFGPHILEQWSFSWKAIDGIIKLSLLATIALFVYPKTLILPVIVIYAGPLLTSFINRSSIANSNVPLE